MLTVYAELAKTFSAVFIHQLRIQLHVSSADSTGLLFQFCFPFGNIKMHNNSNFLTVIHYSCFNCGYYYY